MDTRIFLLYSTIDKGEKNGYTYFCSEKRTIPS